MRIKRQLVKAKRPVIIILAVLFLLFPLFILVADDQIIALENGKQIILHSDFTWEYLPAVERRTDYSAVVNNEVPQYFRQGIRADRNTIILAIKLYEQGWRYEMPRPKSAQARWGNTDGRTTWWNGYWYNVINENLVSQTQPIEKLNVIFYGDNQDLRNTWRNGGSPPFPTKIEWLLSSGGGVVPR